MTANDWKKRVEEIAKISGNNFCADCGKPKPDWAVWNLGIFVCIDCSGIHREIGTSYSKVKSCWLDSWTEEQISIAKNNGNTKVNKIYENKKPCYILNIKDVDIRDYTRLYVNQKYVSKIWYNDNDDEKENNNNDDNKEVAPIRLVLGVFFLENKKKKVYLHISGPFLYYYKNQLDSFSSDKYNISNLIVKLEENDDGYNILEISTEDENVLFRLRGLNFKDNKHKMTDLNAMTSFAQSLLQTKAFYKSEIAPKLRLSKVDTKPKDKLTKNDLSNGTILGFASKKGGNSKSFRKRWWVLLDTNVYYFKEDFRQNKKNPNEGTPAGAFSLYGTDVAWDKNQQRSSKPNCFVLHGDERIYFLQPENGIKDKFYSIIEETSLKLWPRQQIDFCKLTLSN